MPSATLAVSKSLLSAESVCLNARGTQYAAGKDGEDGRGVGVWGGGVGEGGMIAADGFGIVGRICCHVSHSIGPFSRLAAY